MTALRDGTKRHRRLVGDRPEVTQCDRAAVPIGYALRVRSVRRLAIAALLCSSGCAIESAGLGPTDGGPDAHGAFDARVRADARERDAHPEAATVDALAIDAIVSDGALPEPDAGPLSFYDLGWSAPLLIDLVGSPDPCGEDRALDPILTSDRRWLAVSRFEMDCSVRRFHFFEWNDGAPVWSAVLGPLVPADTEHNGHLWNGAPLGRPADELLVFTTGGSGSPRELRFAWLTGSPPVTAKGAVERPLSLDGPDAEDGPSVTLDGARIVLSVDDDVREAIGAPPDAFADLGTVGPAADLVAAEVDPAISPDGRVLVFARIAPAAQPDLWMTRRRELEDPWEPASPLTALNTPDGEWDPFIASNGDLLFTRREGTRQRVYLARAILP